ncbi:PREDICTED: uncharacterized protein LOC106315412 isoform X2 [Brassica oleracea var. oleracea]|uniref:uncharacterized protein LOC106315412 isoform X2 n=1 Tax=Brassica oleracea var. oleracea TaxID=109376 RepID=UPI0006A6C5F4|nr:PREDICTED: uncharacterized protein LOC106315412 isoform X2 [Brassica oleracea var. oleracea]
MSDISLARPPSVTASISAFPPSNPANIHLTSPNSSFVNLRTTQTSMLLDYTALTPKKPEIRGDSQCLQDLSQQRQTLLHSHSKHPKISTFAMEEKKCQVA